MKKCLLMVMAAMSISISQVNSAAEVNQDLELENAINDGQLDQVVNLVNNLGASVNCISSDNYPILHVAASTYAKSMESYEYGLAKVYLSIIKFLLTKGADPDCVDLNGESVLHLAARGNYVGLAKLLIAFRANVEIQDDLGRTSLDDAEQHKSDEWSGDDTFKLLLKELELYDNDNDPSTDGPTSDDDY
jgi:ankyrin repeat protein